MFDGRLSFPLDIRIDHHKVDTTRDLIINTARPRFSWKIPAVDETSRSIQQTAYQIQLESIQLTGRDNYYEWDTGQIVSSQSTHVPYTGDADLLSSTYYRLRIRI